MDIQIEANALLATAPAQTTVDALNEALLPHGLWLPIQPLERSMTLATLVLWNAGGRRRFGYGTITRYMRSATVCPEDDSDPVILGGTTMKRATGYRLSQALMEYLPGILIDVSVGVRPLPPARATWELHCPSLAVACRIGQVVRGLPLQPNALAIRPNIPNIPNIPDTPHSNHNHLDDTSPPDLPIALLIEYDGERAVLERHIEQLTPTVLDMGAVTHHCGVQDIMHNQSDANAANASWRPWEEMAERWHTLPATELCTVSLPFRAVPTYMQQAKRLAERYHLRLCYWGDIGVGSFSLRLRDENRQDEPGDCSDKPLTSQRAAEHSQAVALLLHLAKQHGGSLSTEFGTSRIAPVARRLFPLESLATLASVETYSPTRHLANTSPLTSLIEHLQSIVGIQNVLTRSDDIVCYETDASIAHCEGHPCAVVLPATTEEVARVVRAAAEADTPIVTRGSGSGLAGGATPIDQCILLVLTRMQAMEIDPQQMIAKVEAGVITNELQQTAASYGLTYPPDPSSQAVSTIGGNIACNAGGPRCLKYGVTSDYVLSLTAVLSNGRVIRVGDGLAAQSPDAGIMQLLIGSEGTLAVVTEATLRLLPKPTAQQTTMAIFDDIDEACGTVEMIIAAGIIPAALELMDGTTIGVVEDYTALGLPRDAGALLLMLADGEPETVSSQTAVIVEMARQGGAREVQQAHSVAEEAALWQGRRSIGPALARRRPNKLGEDICVPVPRIAETVKRIKAIAAEVDLPIPVFGHAGDGNLHPNILFDARDANETARVWQAADAIAKLALEMGGTLSGEHGIGLLKRPYMHDAFGEEEMRLQHLIKQSFDANNLLNPGKLLPPLVHTNDERPDRPW
jgi:glycolate oxidase subunit GlcD